MMQRWLSVVVAGVLTAGAVPTAVGGPGDRPERGPHEVRGRHRAGNPVKYMKMLGRFEQEVVGALDPDEELASEIAALFEEHFARMREEMKSLKERRRETADDIRALVKELREAQTDDDPERAEEIRREIVALRQEQASPSENHDELFDSIRELLDDEQLETFDEYVERFEARISGSDGDRAGIQRLRKAVYMLNLSSEQRSRTRELFTEAMREMRAAGRDAERLEKLEASLHESIIDELDEEQVAALEDNLAKLKGPKEHQRRPGGHDRARRGAGSAGDDDSASAPALEEAEVEQPEEAAEETVAEEEEKAEPDEREEEEVED